MQIEMYDLVTELNLSRYRRIKKGKDFSNHPLNLESEEEIKRREARKRPPTKEELADYLDKLNIKRFSNLNT